MELPGRGQAPGCVGGIQHEDALARAGQVGGTGEAVVPRADDDGVVVLQGVAVLKFPAICTEYAFALKTTTPPIREENFVVRDG